MRGVGEQVRFLPNTSGRSEGQCHLGKFKIFTLEIFTLIFTLILETVFPVLKLTQNWYISKYKHTLFLKTGDSILNWFPLSFFYKHPMPERLSLLGYSLVNWE